MCRPLYERSFAAGSWAGTQRAGFTRRVQENSRFIAPRGGVECPFPRGDESPALRTIRPLKRARRVSPPDRGETRDVYRRVEHVPPTAGGSQSVAEMATCSPLRKASFTAGFWAAVQGAPFMGRVESSRAINRPAGAPSQVCAPNRTPTTHPTSQTEVRATAVNVARVSTRVSNPTSKASAKHHTPEPAQPDIANQPANRAPVFLSPHPLHLPPSPYLLKQLEIGSHKQPPAASNGNTTTSRPASNIAN